MILYPVDSIVDLSNGEKARVVKNNEHYILRPTVVGVESGRVYDLGDDLKCAISYFIYSIWNCSSVHC